MPKGSVNICGNAVTVLATTVTIVTMAKAGAEPHTKEMRQHAKEASEYNAKLSSGKDEAGRSGFQGQPG